MTEVFPSRVRSRAVVLRRENVDIGALQGKMLLTGVDEIGLMEARAAARAAFDASDAQARPWIRTRSLQR